MTNVFISWSGEQSKKIAEELRTWIPSVLQFAKPYYTPNDIEKGSKWSSEISKQLAKSNIGIVCLTKDNFNKPWILFEAGALSKDLENSKVCSVLFGMDNTDLTGPLTTFQATQFSKSDFKKLMQAINGEGGEQALNPETFSRVFEMWWPQLAGKVEQIVSSEAQSDKEEIRSDRDLLEEILSLTRSRSRVNPRFSRVPAGLVRDLTNSIETIHEENQSALINGTVNSALELQIKVARFLARESETVGEEVEEKLQELDEKVESFIPF